MLTVDVTQACEVCGNTRSFTLVQKSVNLETLRIRLNEGRWREIKPGVFLCPDDIDKIAKD